LSYDEVVSGLESGSMTVEDVAKAYSLGKLSDIDICRLATEKYITFKDAGSILGRSTISASRYCRKLIDEEQAREVVEEAMSTPSIPSGRGRKGGAVQQPQSPVQNVMAEVTGRVVSEAVMSLDYFVSLGKTVHNLAYYYASKDPRYSETLKTNPKEAVVAFLEDSMAFYVAWQDIMGRISSMISRLYSVIERYESVIQSLLPKLYPSIKYEAETKLALTLIDRMILARLLGIKIGKKLPKVAFAWVDALGDEVIRSEVAKQLFGGVYNG